MFSASMFWYDDCLSTLFQFMIAHCSMFNIFIIRTHEMVFIFMNYECQCVIRSCRFVQAGTWLISATIWCFFKSSSRQAIKHMKKCELYCYLLFKLQLFFCFYHFFCFLFSFHFIIIQHKTLFTSISSNYEHRSTYVCIVLCIP